MFEKIGLLVLALVAAANSAACGSSGGDSGSGAASATEASASTGTGGAAPTATFAEVRTIFDANCGSCHGPGNPNVVLSGVSDAVLLTTLTTALPASSVCPNDVLVTPGDGAGSILIDKLTSTTPRCQAGGRMPLDSVELDAADIATITAWINAGAKG